MFALAALIVALLALFGGHIGGVNLLWLWAAFISVHLMVGWWPFPGRSPYWRRD